MIKKMIEKLSFSEFPKKEDGNIFITTALIAPLLVIAIGVAVDTSEIYRAKINFQNALDAGAIMAAKVIAAEGGTPEAKAKAELAGTNVFMANMRNLDPSKSAIRFHIPDEGCSAGPITATATLNHPVYFDFWHNLSDTTGIEDHAKLDGETEVQCGNTTLEIALVLDNSGSMGFYPSVGDEIKIETLRNAAREMVTTLHESFGQMNGVSEPLKFSVVPFSSMVNVGSGNKSQNWMDTEGLSSIHHEHLNWDLDPNAIKNPSGIGYQDSDGNPLTRFTLFDNLNEPWMGCVETRPYPLLTTDAGPSTADPDTLIVPAFAPDTPDDWSGQYDKRSEVNTAEKAICTRFDRRHRRYRGYKFCSAWSDGTTGWSHSQKPRYFPTSNDRIEYRNGNYIGPPRSAGATTWINDARIDEESYWNSYLRDDHNFPSSLNSDPRAKENTGTADQEQYKRQKWTWKYFTDSSGNAPAFRDTDNGTDGLPNFIGLRGGPNNFCLTPPLLPLTTSQVDTEIALDNLVADGSTHIQQGTVWGWRTLSSGEPFSQGRARNAANNKKVMIVMTDGANTYYPVNYWGHGKSDNNKSFYGAHGMAVNERINQGDSNSASGVHTFDDYRKGLDSHLAETCENAKTDGIEIHTIAFDVADDSPVRDLLRSCASTDAVGAPFYYPAENSEDLTATFREISERLSDLKIVK